MPCSRVIDLAKKHFDRKEITNMSENKKLFTEPECEVIVMDVADVITTSDDPDWGMGEF